MEQRLKLINQFKELFLPYKFALDYLSTTIEHINEEAMHVYDYNPIEHIKTRLKSPESVISKLQRKGLPIEFASAKQHLSDIVGVRIICSFVSDIYDLYEILRSRHDIKIIECKDYIKSPKPNGYQSLHLIVEVPILLSKGTERVLAEIQLRTLGMDFWASLEHKIFYKYNKDIPERLKRELYEAANMTVQLDAKMKAISDEVGHLSSPYAMRTVSMKQNVNRG
ncbi:MULTISPECIES: GTP pyrophosphokinase family protein [unclassified Paenibacillus]|uniref:GTP pyrophosphokinase n=1 Tax=unclassified Paenibacillus TaxID=185978 RepID=UPI001AE309EC|nr:MULTISPECIES: GTP pyrophosphokinase family protein [unclassified Paenibacillus]MBP1157605.1 putative GTP pyrophosphokinase [Paenibacillus sp. PvP091]MBP1171658.1 putative GTP pyrophosphokinase [Paenibacillus sp. PvR098]MBP2438039.1 putative GTP pyrophosphokinase [Paenibacillus sp. PvP052]